MSQQSKPLFEPIRMEPIELEAAEIEQQPQEPSIPEFSRIQLTVMTALYLLVLVGNGQITIPLFMVIPLIIIHIFQSSIDITVPSIVGLIGLCILIKRITAKGSATRQQSANANLGLILLLTSLFFYWTVSEAVLATFTSSLLFAILYFYWASTVKKV